MTKSIEFYYDFTAPYSFLAHKKIREIEKKESINFIYKSILLGRLHNLKGITASAFIASEKKFMIQDYEIVAKKSNINFKFNDKFSINTLNLMRGILIIKKELKNKYIDLFFDPYWSFNIDLPEETNIKNILEKIQINANTFFNNIDELETKDLLKNLTKESFDKKIFAAPTFIVNNKLFWGQDRFDYVIDEF